MRTRGVTDSDHSSNSCLSQEMLAAARAESVRCTARPRRTSTLRRYRVPNGHLRNLGGLECVGNWQARRVVVESILARLVHSHCGAQGVPRDGVVFFNRR
jgi:hypothetical protein